VIKLLKSLMFALFVSLLLVAPAWAQEDGIQQAQEHFQQGAEFYTSGEYSKAIVEFLKGYNLAPNPMFLYNISLSYAKMDNIEEALRAADRANKDGGLPAEVQLRNESRILAFRAALTAQSASTSMKQVAKVEPEPTPPVSSSGFGALGWAGVALTTVGAGLMVGALVVNAPLADNIAELERESIGGDQARFNELKQSIEDDQSLGQILLFAGAGVGAVGVTLLIIELLSGEETSAAMTLIPHKGGAIVGVGGVF